MKRLTCLRAFMLLLACAVCANAQTTANAPVAASSPSPATNGTPAPSPSPAKAKSAAAPAPSTAAKGSFVIPPEKSKPIAIPKFDKPPVIDGKLTDDVWQQAVVLKDFYQIQPG